jgi:hypothetical protein
MFCLPNTIQRLAGCPCLLVLAFTQVIPGALVRRLALRKLQLTDEEDEDDDNDNLTYAAAKGTSGRNVAGNSTSCFATASQTGIKGT